MNTQLTLNLNDAVAHWSGLVGGAIVGYEFNVPGYSTAPFVIVISLPDGRGIMRECYPAAPSHYHFTGYLGKRIERVQVQSGIVEVYLDSGASFSAFKPL